MAHVPRGTNLPTTLAANADNTTANAHVQTTVSPVVFVGISTPLTWATALTASMQPPLNTDVDVEPSGAPPSPSSPSPPVPLAVLTEQDAPTRQPAPSALATYHLEQQLLRMAQRPALSVRILCPGVLYGNGEDDGALHGLLRAAWEGTLPLQLPSYTQTYRLPTLHVRDMAAIAVSIAVEPPPPDRQYLLAVDSLQLTLGGLLGALESALGCAGARCVPRISFIRLSCSHSTCIISCCVDNKYLPLLLDTGLSTLQRHCTRCQTRCCSWTCR